VVLLVGHIRPTGPSSWGDRSGSVSASATRAVVGAHAMSDMMFMVLDVFAGSDGDKTKALYARLDSYGPIGIIGTNLFRAQKNSTRAKAYRGGNRQGSFRGQAYERKEWAIGNLCAVLKEHAEALGIRWGWKLDPKADYIPWVLYVDLPLKNDRGESIGQVSFHTPSRGAGPDYPGEWDGIPDQSTTRIVRFIAEQILATVPA
jgi:hypothetical protein